MTPTETASTRSYRVLLAAAGLCVLSSLLMMPYVPDDSYISFRYAENLVNGEGLAFNTAEGPVEAQVCLEHGRRLGHGAQEVRCLSR